MTYWIRNITKHPGNPDHDQKDHGNWADGSGDYGPEGKHGYYSMSTSIRNQVDDSKFMSMREHTNQINGKPWHPAAEKLQGTAKNLVVPVIKRVMGRAAAMGWQLPGRVIVGAVGSHPGGTAISAIGKYAIIALYYPTKNMDSELKSDDEVAELFRKSWTKNEKGVRWSTSRNYEDLAMHELAHIQHGNLGKPMELDSWVKGLEDRISAEVSEYASTEGSEFVAEAAVMLARGEKLPDDLMALYRRMNGPEFKS